MFLDVELLFKVCYIPRSSCSPVILPWSSPSSFTLHSSFYYFSLKPKFVPLIICRIQFRCLVLIIVKKDLSSSTSFNTSFYMCSVKVIFSVLRHILISKASNLVMSSFLRAHVSAQSNVALPISVFTILSLRHLHTSQCPFGNSFLLEKASFSLLSMGVNPGG